MDKPVDPPELVPGSGLETEAEVDARHEGEREVVRLWRWKWWVVALLLSPLLGPCVPSIHDGLTIVFGYRQPLFDAINQCPRATAALGAPVQTAQVGLSMWLPMGEDREEYGGRLPVAGPKASGALVYRTERKHLTRAELRLAGETIDLLSCGGL